MAYANINPKVLGYLGRALSLEMTAIQQYCTVSRLLKLRGFEQIADKFKHEMRDELEHVERIVGRMLVLGVAPNASQLRPAKVGDSLPALIASVYMLEQEIIDFYQQAVSFCIQVEDFDNRMFFEQLLHEEQKHADELKQWRQDLSQQVKFT